MKKMVLLRHGESTWNKENRFTGWTDVGLTEKGSREAVEAGRLLRKEGFVFDTAFTSVLKRAIKTLCIAGPTGGSKKKPVGLVFIGLADNKKTLVIRVQLKGSRRKVKEKAAEKSLKILYDYLKETAATP